MYFKIPGAADKHKMDIFMYEIDMVNALPKMIGKENSTYLNNAAVESFLIHVRALKDFFEGNNNYSDDLTCLDFKSRNGKPCSPQILELKADFKKALDKSVAHITKTRLLHKVEWDILLIRNAINKAAYLFLSSCSPEEFPSEGKRIEYISYFDSIRKS